MQNTKNDHQVVGFLKQIKILLWKNYILSKRNIIGTTAEILIALVVWILLILIRYFTESRKYFEQDYTEFPVAYTFFSKNTRDLVYYSPNNDHIKSIVENGFKILKNIRSNNFYISPLPSPDINSFLSQRPELLSRFLAYIEFPQYYTNSTLPDNILYSLHTQEQPSIQYNIEKNLHSLNDFKYIDSPESYCAEYKHFRLYDAYFLSIKHVIDLSIISHVSGSNFYRPDLVRKTPFNCLAFNYDILKTRFTFFVVYLIIIGYLITLIVNIGNIIVEKETKMKEYLKLVGVKWYAIWISWLIRSLIPYAILTVLYSVIFIAKFIPRLDNYPYEKKAIFFTTDWFIGFSLLFLYSIQTSMFTLLMGQFFSKTFIAKIFMIILWIITAIDFDSTIPAGLKYFLCLFPNYSIVFSFQVINQFERSGRQLSYANLYTNLYDDPLTLGGIFSMMIVWTIIYIPIAWYIELVFPGEYGAPLPYYFPFLPSYWTGSIRKNKVKSSSLEYGKEFETNKVGFENDPSDLNVAISVRNLTKKFRLGFKQKTVLDNISIDIYKNQITGLLGHNGAGKTTLTFILSGIYGPDLGDAYILDKSIKTQINEIRSSIGFCPQQNILFDDLTVSEHLDFIASIKGFSKREIKKEVFNISKLVGLEDDLKKKTKELSGGMKRRLSVAMALTGGSEIAILDEPTSGLDPYNRRGLWELIKNFKKDRTIILTTHFMEEADALSDRICIMNHGKIVCCGSPLYLKNTFGSGYKLTISKNKAFDEESFMSFLDKNLTKYSIETNIAAEINVSIPFILVNKIPEFLNAFEKTKKTLGIDSYGISSPTIEEIFIKVGSIDTSGKEFKIEETLFNENQLSKSFSNEFDKNFGFRLWFQHIQALLTKRFRIFIRRYILAIAIFGLPFASEAIIAALIPTQTNIINSIRGIVSSNGEYFLTLNNYSTHTIPVYISSNIDQIFARNYVENYFKTKPNLRYQKFDTDTIQSYVKDYRKQNVKNIFNDYFVGLNLKFTADNTFTFNYFYSQIAYHSSANMLNEIDNLIFQMVLNFNPNKSIQTINSPIAAQQLFANITSSTNGSSFLETLACIGILPLSILDMANSLIVAFMIGIMVLYIARERLNGSKQLQYLSGVNYTTYWFSNYLFDIFVFIINISLIVFILKMVDLSKNDPSSEIYAIAHTDDIGYLYLLFLFSCLSWPLIVYIWSFKFKSDIVGFITLTGLLGLIAFLDAVLAFLELIITTNNSSKQSAGSRFLRVLKHVLSLLFPNVNIKRGVYYLKVRNNAYCIDYVNVFLDDHLRLNEPILSINEPGIGLLLFYSCLQFLLYILILWSIELNLKEIIIVYIKLQINKIKKSSEKTSTDQNEHTEIDSDVQAEIDRIKWSNLKELSRDEPLVVFDLVKKYKNNKTTLNAVDHLSFGVNKNECFGLIGFNGAGKSTTFKILIGEIKPTSGKAYINGYNIQKHKKEALKNLGFCPQFDILPEYLTVNETFNLIANLRGIKTKSRTTIIDSLKNVFKLNEFDDKLVQNLSGGNKRKLSSALAFIGKNVIFLDEPTSGMDPAARKYLWTVIKKARDFGMTIVLTTHSMDESEALCDKIGIMVNGQLKCLGSVQHLKSKFGNGYSLILKCKNQNENVLNVENFIKSNVPNALLENKQQETLFYKIRNDTLVTGNIASSFEIISISDLFKLIENNKDVLNLEAYSLSQASLEQVFLSFAKEQNQVNDNQQKPSILKRFFKRITGKFHK